MARRSGLHLVFDEVVMTVKYNDGWYEIEHCPPIEFRAVYSDEWAWNPRRKIGRAHV